MELAQLQKATQIDERRGGSGPIANQVLRRMQVGKGAMASVRLNKSAATR